MTASCEYGCGTRKNGVRRPFALVRPFEALAGSRGWRVWLACLLMMALASCSSAKSSAAAPSPAAALVNEAAQAKPDPAAVSTTATATPVPGGDSSGGPVAHFSGERAMQYTREAVAMGPRPVGSTAHEKLESYLRNQLKPLGPEVDTFTASTPLGPKIMRNYIVKLAGTRPGVVVVCGHYDTKLLKDFVGANDGGSSTGLLLELARELRLHLKDGKLGGYSVWLVWLDGEEAFREWTDADSGYGSRHLAEKWQADGTLKNIKALLLVDMIGDADLDILQDENSTPWLEQVVYEAAKRLGYQSHFFLQRTAIGDDHVPFASKGVPAADLIDFTYGYNNAYWHTKEDTMDKLSPKSFGIVGSVVLETIRLLNQR
jgi:Zn-dependent M28 family amino/carboxypeptidase